MLEGGGNNFHIIIIAYLHLKNPYSFDIFSKSRRSGGMVDTTDSKSVASNRVRVQVSSPVLRTSFV